MEAVSVIRIPQANIVAMIFVCLAVFGVVPALAIFIGRKYKGKFLSFLIGAATFIVFVFVLEQFLHILVLQNLGGISEAIMGNILLYGLYGGLAAGIFEETGRYLSMRFLMKKNLNGGNALMYGIGHGGIEAILLVGVMYLGQLANALVLNSGALDEMFQGELGAEMLAAYGPLAETQSYLFYIAGAERMMAITLHLALSVLVYVAVSRKKSGYYFLAVALHASVDFTVVVVASSVSTIAAELACLVGVAAAVVLAVRAFQKYGTT